MTYLYIYQSADQRFVYIGIGDSMSRVWEDHNPEAQRLRDTPGCTILQTVEPFRNRADARKAEAIAIHIASLSGKRVVHVEDVDGTPETVVTPPDSGFMITNDAGTSGTTSVLGPAIFSKDGEVPYSSLQATVLVPISPDEIDERPSLHGGLEVARFAERAEKYWNLGASRRRGDRIARLIAVLRRRNIILGDWDLDPSDPYVEDDHGPTQQFKLVDAADDDPRDVKGMHLNFDTEHRLNQGVTYSADIRQSW